MSVTTTSPNICRSEALFVDRSISWHGLRGYDFAGLDAILREGIRPTKRQVSISRSPVESWENNMPANSFATYTLADGISLAVEEMGDIYHPDGGYYDEMRSSYIPNTSIRNVLIPESATTTPLREIRTTHEPRRPEQTRAYIARGVSLITRLGGDIDMKATREIEKAYLHLEADERLSEEDQTNLESALLVCFAGVAAKILDKQDSTPLDVLSVVLPMSSMAVSVSVFSPHQKDKVVARNHEIMKRRTDLTRSLELRTVGYRAEVTTV